MPIKGLSDRGLSFPEIGQIRKGSPKTEKRPGEDLTYFRVIFDEREVKAKEAFDEIYKTGKPTSIRIILPFNEIERMWESWLEAYTAGRMVARSDGERYIYLVDTKTGNVIVQNGEPFTPYDPAKPAGYDYKNKPVFCKPSGRLKVIIPELARAAYMTVLTTSIHDIANISAQLEAFSRLNNGRIAGIPFILRRRPKKISRPDSEDKTKRVRVEKWLLSIEADPEWVKAKLIEMKNLALPGNGINLLPEALAPDVPEPTVEPPAGFTYYDDDENEEETIEGEVSETTPEPEIINVQPPASVAKPRKVKDDTDPRATALVEAKIVQDETEAAAVLAKINIKSSVPLEEVVKMVRGYNGWKDLQATDEQAIKYLSNGYYPK
jgi:hypothetical protein